MLAGRLVSVGLLALITILWLLRPSARAASVIMREMPVDVKSLIQEGAELTDRALEALAAVRGYRADLRFMAAMRHSTFAGGKRLRPVLAMQAAVTIAGRLPKGIEQLGAAIEMLHTYSLIHDDLPALDNDDLRRGKPTCHVAFGEAIAILAGDALADARLSKCWPVWSVRPPRPCRSSGSSPTPSARWTA